MLAYDNIHQILSFDLFMVYMQYITSTSALDHIKLDQLMNKEAI